MFEIWLYSLVSVFVVSLISFIGVLALSIKREKLNKILLLLVSFSAGAMLGDAFIHLLPELAEDVGFGVDVSLYVLVGIIIFFASEKIVHWKHCHPYHHHHIEGQEKTYVHSFAIMNLVGDFIHNFLDGIIIGAAYLVSIPVGIATTLAVIFHEIPQEIGDFGVLLHGGFAKNRALLLNFITALSSIIGAVVSLSLSFLMTNVTNFLVPIAAGGFIYIAGSDLIPELHKEPRGTKSILQLVLLIAGVAVMYGLLFIAE